MQFNKEQVLDFLPHRAPFLFIDTVESVTLPSDLPEEPTGKDLIGTEVVAHFEVKEDLEILKGHFPGNPILPGVIQTEMMAQSAAFASIGMRKKGQEDYGVETLLLGVETCKFRKPILPGMKLRICGKMTKCRGPIATYSCEITCEGEKVSQANLLAKLTLVKR